MGTGHSDWGSHHSMSKWLLLIEYRNMVNSLYMDVTFDESSFEKYFEWIDQESFQSKL